VVLITLACTWAANLPSPLLGMRGKRLGLQQKPRSERSSDWITKNRTKWKIWISWDEAERVAGDYLDWWRVCSVWLLHSTASGESKWDCLRAIQHRSKSRRFSGAIVNCIPLLQCMHKRGVS